MYGLFAVCFEYYMSECDNWRHDSPAHPLPYHQMHMCYLVMDNVNYPCYIKWAHTYLDLTIPDKLLQQELSLTIHFSWVYRKGCRSRPIHHHHCLFTMTHLSSPKGLPRLSSNLVGIYLGWDPTFGRDHWTIKIIIIFV